VISALHTGKRGVAEPGADPAAGSAPGGLQSADKNRRVDVEPVGDPHDVLEPDVAEAAFNIAQVADLDVCPFGDLALRSARQFSMRSYSLAEGEGR